MRSRPRRSGLSGRSRVELPGLATVCVKYGIHDYFIPGGGLMRIRWHGHACFEIDGSVQVVTDPHDGKSIGIAPPKAKADLVLVSHDHFDHNCARLVKKQDATVLSSPIMTVEQGVRVEGIEASHDEVGGAKRGKIVMFRFELDGTSFCHLGDLGHDLDDAVIEKICPVDFLFVPVGDVFTIGPAVAKAIVDRIGPKVAVPMHYRTQGLSLSIRPVQDFLALCGKDQVVKVGNEVDFTQEDLPEAGTEVWLFTP